MLKKILIICALTISGLTTLQANEATLACKRCHEEENRKDLTPGVLVCNRSENRCKKVSEKNSSSHFAVFCEDHQDEEKLLACKDCK